MDKLGASTAEFALMQSLFSGAQALGGVLSGALSRPTDLSCNLVDEEVGSITSTPAAGPVLDACGGKVLLLISFASSVVCYGLTASATSLTVLYVSRAATLLQHAALAARSIVTASTDHHSRALHLGYVSMCVGIGMSAGPIIGGATHKRQSVTNAGLKPV